VVAGTSPREKAGRFLAAHPDLFSAAGAELRHQETLALRDLRVVRFRQHYRGLPVEGSLIAVSLDGAGHVVSVSDESVSSFGDLPVTPRVDALAAARIARTQGGSGEPRAAWAKLLVLGGAAPRLAYQVALPTGLDQPPRLAYVDALSGRFLGWRPAAVIDALPAKEVLR